MTFDPKHSRARALREVGVSACRGALIGAAVLAIAAPFYWHHRERTDHTPQITAAGGHSVVTSGIRLAEFNGMPASNDVRQLADWIADSRDNGRAGFVVIDKKLARAYVFDAAARLLGSSPVLLGAARGDDSVPGIGSRPISQVTVPERTTPAGRFIAARGRNSAGEDVVWVDYDAAVSMHRVRATDPKERRLERLATETPDDNRISYGCINVPVAFYEAYVRPTFDSHSAVVYVLPDLKSVQQVFGSRDLATARSRRLPSSYL